MNEKIKEIRQDTQKAEDFFTKRLAYTLGPVELKNFMEKGGVKVVDVRLKADYDIAHIPGAISIPKDELDKRLTELSKDEITIVYCYNQQCHLGDNACLGWKIFALLQVKVSEILRYKIFEAEYSASNILLGQVPLFFIEILIFDIFVCL